MADDETCWTLIRAAAAGDLAGRERFARLYLPAVRAYFASRWRGSLRVAPVDDAAQDVFVELLRQGGALDAVRADRPGGFRAYLFGVARNVARRHESKAQPLAALPADLPTDEATLEAEFDRAWARALLREAARVQEEAATLAGGRAGRRVELLRLRFQEGLPIRAIAARWAEDPAVLHHEYATARIEFRAALRRVAAFDRPEATADELDEACRELLALLG